ncbi:conserved hypothetical protein [Methylococcus capsulatus str. Bath]|uniref:Uncharacterized protein n=1 Tax=Methylococcus capsulatus (strain ATCC 33009 / NCIMB 11132 / Bath) TaxID=243233 RepID=Q603X3_METCA|nr:hypothetical protein [Methylococcus capsulatus]AAU91173.1 conserved hypothetical protein [Methylococcus capsulatus str. Bath]
MPDLSVKYFNSGMAGAPQISNNWGDLVSMLDACLVNGFALKAIDTLTFANGIATATITSGHAYQRDQVVQVAGAEQPEYNGQFRVLTTTATTFTYAVTGTPASPATTATSLSAKVAPLGWEKPFAGTNKAAYRSKNPASPQNLLLIDDSLKTPGYTTSWAKWANVGIVEDLADIDTIVGAQAPYDPNNPTQNWKQVTANQWGWHKWYHARQTGYDTYGDSGGGNRNWVLVGDDRLFFLFCTFAPGFNWYGRSCYCFGDITSFKPGDNYATVLAAHDLYWSNNNQYMSYPGEYGGASLIASLDFSGHVLLRNHTQLGNPVRWAATSLNTNNGQQICGRGPMPFPNGADYSLWLLPTYVRQEDGHMRGLMPGMYWMPQDRPYSDQTIVDNVVGQTGKRFLLVRTQYSSETEGAQVAFDITGPWR